MEWTYRKYIAMNYGIGCGLAVLTVTLLYIFVWLCDAGSYIIKSVVAIDLEGDNKKSVERSSLAQSVPSIDSPDFEQGYEKITVHHHRIRYTISRHRCLSKGFILMCIFIIAVMPIVILEGCVIGSLGVENGDACPDDPMDCFVFERSIRHEEKGSFKCRPGITANLTGIYDDGYAWCYGWIITRQTTKKVLDQLGICAGLIGIFATLFALLIYISRTRSLFILSIVFVVIVLAAGVALIAIYRWAVSILTYLVLILCLFMGIWSLILVCYLRTWKKQDKRGIPGDLIVIPYDDHTNIRPRRL